MRVALSNLGCKLNQAETDRIARELSAAGHEVVPKLEEADLHVVNSCTVTHRAARDSRKMTRRGHRRNERLKTVVTGCWVSEDPERAAQMAGVDLVVPNRDKDRLIERIRTSFPELWATGSPVPEESIASAGAMGEDAVPVPWVPIEVGRTRSLVKVEDGCNMRCAFCIIPSTRGRQRSRQPDEVVAEVGALAAAGIPEIVITGVQISEYRWEDRRLYELLRELVSTLKEVGAPTRLRVTSLAPWRFDRRLLGLWPDERGGEGRGERLCRHLHLSLQSGSASVLRRMRRPYGPDRYRRLLDEIRAAIPGVALTTDVITGFPGETEEEHRESLDFVESCGFAGVHVFGYSVREGTEAAGMEGRLDPRIVKRRTHQMIAVGRRSEEAFRLRQVGGLADVVWEERSGGRWRGLTDNYLRVWSEDAVPTGGRGPARLLESTPEGLRARPVA